MKRSRTLNCVLAAFFVFTIGGWAPEVRGFQDEKAPTLTDDGQAFAARYEKELSNLRDELTARLPKAGDEPKVLNEFLSGNALDAKLVKFVVLNSATSRGLAEFAQRGQEQAALIEQLLADADLMRQMLVADGANAPIIRRSQGPAQYGAAMKILSDIDAASDEPQKGILQRLAVAIALEHAVPVAQTNPESFVDAPKTVDPVKRYLHYRDAFLNGELDPAFDQLSTWELRMVVNGDEPDETLAWGREMLRTYRPDHIFNPNYGWRYVSLVTSDVKYGSQCVKFDRPELQKYQNILMNGGVCGRRAFIGRFILRAFGIPTIARPSRGHGALAHWTPQGWVVNLGGGWGAGWTRTRYKSDLDFLATTQARENPDSFLKVKRAYWAGDVLGETRTYNEQAREGGYWNNVALQVQREIINDSKAKTLAALGEELGESDTPTIAEKVMASPAKAVDKKIVHGPQGAITIPAAAFSKPVKNTRDVVAMKSFDGGLQVFLPRFFPQGQTVLRGGTWKGEPDACTSGKRLLSGGYGKYENWGLRVAMTPIGPATHRQEISLDLGNGVTMDMVYIQPGSFIMGGESKTDGRFHCVEVPRHEVQLTKGFYLGKFEVTQAQYEAIMGTNPSKSTKAPDCPVDNVGESDAVTFCGKLAEKTGRDLRLPTEAEWEYASRAGRDSKWFFGNDPTELGEYAWFKGNADKRSHPVGQKKPNPWGLYDIYGNVCERISDKYARNYYAVSPKVDPTGPNPGSKSRFEYQIDVPRAGRYSLSARVVTVNYDQRLNIAVNSSETRTTIELPFTEGAWQDSEGVTVELKQGTNTLRFWRDQPPQYGLGVKEFRLTPIQ